MVANLTVYTILIYQIQCLCSHKLVGNWLLLRKYDELLQMISLMLYNIDMFQIVHLIYILGVYFPSYANVHFSFIRFSLMANTKY